jgi:5,5'-dehydrodivanillate O-demethylase
VGQNGGVTTAQYTPSDYTDFVHTGPGTLAGRFMRRFWQPVYRAEDLQPGHAKPIRIMHEDFTLYRGEDGAPHLLDFRCAHRGTQLSTGWVEGDCIRCFYHGWKYDQTGQCVEQPAEDASFASKVKIRSYPCEEYLGLIFAYFGEGERDETGAVGPPPLPRFPEFEGEGVWEVLTYLRGCGFFQNVENSLDQIHVAFVHRVGPLAQPELLDDLPRVEVEETDYGLAVYGVQSRGPRRVSHFLMPNLLYFTLARFGTGVQQALAWRVPVDADRHQNFNVTYTPVTGEAAQGYRERAERRLAAAQALSSTDEITAAIMRGDMHVDDTQDRPDVVTIQDHIAQMGQGAIADRTRERLGRSDVGVLQLRRLWERELRALAEGRPLKQWSRPAELVATRGG